MTRYLGGLITKDESLVIPSDNFEDTSAPGVWTLEEAQALNKQGLWPTAGNTNPSKLVENIFSIDTFFNSNNSADDAGRTITNGIDLAGEGGLVWVKSRTSVQDHSLTDTVRGVSARLSTNSSGENVTGSKYDKVDQFNSNGFRYPNGFVTAQDYVAWTFRKAPKFFDVVGYTGDNSSSARNIAHSLGQAPGMIIIKRYSDSGYGWYVWHRSLSNGYWLSLNSTDAQTNGSGVPLFGNNDQQTSTHFQLQATNANVNFFNASGQSYIAYLFGHDTSSDGMIQCGNLTISSQASTNVALGFEPQWILLKHSSSTSNWWLFDTLRGMTSTGFEWLYANDDDAAETKTYQGVFPTSTGFTFNPANNGQFTNGDYIYMAIRKEPMATPTNVTDIFALDFRFSSTAQAQDPKLNYYSGFPVDLQLDFRRSSGGVYVYSRLQGGSNFLKTDTTAAETSSSTSRFDTNIGVSPDTTNSEDTTKMSAMWRRAPGYFDVVAYDGNNTSGRTITHNLGVVPEMIWIKNRGYSGGEDWAVYHKGLNGGTDPEDYYLKINANSSESNVDSNFNDTAPTSTVFTVGNDRRVNGNSADGNKYIAYLFATLAGISKVGSFSHTNGSSTDVDCGFSSGSSFVIAKRRDASGDWYVWDTKKGIVSGNDPYLLLNSSAAEVTNTDYIDTLSSGFQIASGFTTGDYIFYAIAA